MNLFMIRMLLWEQAQILGDLADSEAKDPRFAAIEAVHGSFRQNRLNDIQRQLAELVPGLPESGWACELSESEVLALLGPEPILLAG